MWTPVEIRKLIALCSGVGLASAGVYFTMKGINAEGSINLSSELLSGEIKTGSAGLLLCFLSVVLIVMSSTTLPAISRATPKTGRLDTARTHADSTASRTNQSAGANDAHRPNEASPVGRLFRGTSAAWTVVVVFTVLGYVSEGYGLSSGAALSGWFLAAWCVGFVAFLASIALFLEYVSGPRERENSEDEKVKARATEPPKLSHAAKGNKPVQQLHSRESARSSVQDE